MIRKNIDFNSEDINGKTPKMECLDKWTQRCCKHTLAVHRCLKHEKFMLSKL